MFHTLWNSGCSSFSKFSVLVLRRRSVDISKHWGSAFVLSYFCVITCRLATQTFTFHSISVAYRIFPLIQNVSLAKKKKKNSHLFILFLKI